MHSAQIQQFQQENFLCKEEEKNILFSRKRSNLPEVLDSWYHSACKHRLFWAQRPLPEDSFFFFQIRYVYCISIWFPSSFQWASSSNHISTPAVLWITFDSLNKLHFSLYIFFFFFKIKSILSNTKRIKQTRKEEFKSQWRQSSCS